MYMCIGEIIITTTTIMYSKNSFNALVSLQLSAVVDILRYCHTCTVYSKPRLNVVCQPFKTDFRTCKQLDFDASSYTDRSVLHTIIVNRL